MEPSLEYKYDEYEDDFHDEGANDKNKPGLNVDYNFQTENNPAPVQEPA